MSAIFVTMDDARLTGGQSGEQPLCKVMLLEKARELTSLQRGWCTPDPSSKASFELPKCSAKGFVFVDLDSTSTRGSSPSDLSFRAEEEETCVSDVWSRDRTPSPAGNYLQEESDVSDDLCRYRTPSPVGSYVHHTMRNMLPQNEAALMPCGLFMPTPSPISDSYITTIFQGAEEDFIELVSTPRQYNTCKQNLQCKPCELEEFAVDPSTAISVDASHPKRGMEAPSHGSVGHPFTCAKGCKYASKARGCKDGSSCDRCHLCPWKQTRQQRSQNFGSNLCKRRQFTA